MKNFLKKALVVCLGNFFCALAVSYCIEPAGLLSGGCTGIGLILKHFTSLPTSVGIWGASISFFLLGLFVLGKEYAATIIVGVISFPLAYNITSLMVGATGILTDDIFLCTVFMGLFNGVGIGITLRVGASTGSGDVPAVILYRKFNVPVSVSINVIDGVILCLQIPFSDPRRILYSLLAIVIYSALSGKVVAWGQDKLQIQIYSTYYEEISASILNAIDRGCTLLHIQGGYTREETFAVQTVVTKRQLFRVRETALAIDPQAFLIINPVSDVNGLGFTLSKHYEKEI